MEIFLVFFAEVNFDKANVGARLERSVSLEVKGPRTLGQIDQFFDIPLSSNLSKGELSPRIPVAGSSVIFKSPFRCIVYLEGIVAFFLDVDSEVATLLVMVLFRVIDIAGVIIDLGDCDDPELFKEFFVREEKDAIVFVTVANSLFFSFRYVFPIFVIIIPTG